MKQSAVIIAALVSAGLLATPASTAHAAKNQHRSHVHRQATVTTAPPARIACTQLGCHPIPAACTPVPQLTWDDLPTGFDAIDCPPGVSPLR